MKAEAMLMTMTAREVSGQEPPAVVAAAMKSGGCGNLPHENIDYAYTSQKLRQRKAGARIATMPGITEENVCHGAMNCRLQSCYGTQRQVTELIDECPIRAQRNRSKKRWT